MKIVPGENFIRSESDYGIVKQINSQINGVCAVLLKVNCRSNSASHLCDVGMMYILHMIIMTVIVGGIS
jgi:hypothetical protein